VYVFFPTTLRQFLVRICGAREFITHIHDFAYPSRDDMQSSDSGTRDYRIYFVLAQLALGIRRLQLLLNVKSHCVSSSPMSTWLPVIYGMYNGG